MTRIAAIQLTSVLCVVALLACAPQRLRAEGLDGPLAEYAFPASTAADEALIFTPPGFDKVGVPAEAEGAHVGRLRLAVRDAATGRPLPCRVNVVGPDGNYYEPADGPLKIHSLTGQWPHWPHGWGNRPEKAPIRYFGRFFYCRGDAEVAVPAGPVRVEVWRGFEYRPQSVTTSVAAGEVRALEVSLPRTVPMPDLGYYSGDPHIHIPRNDDADEQKILDLLEAEDIHFGTVLAYNEPAGPYVGVMQRMDAPQFRGLGRRSILTRSDYHLLSGQEYRSGTYGHLNLFLLDELVLRDQSLNADNWPLYGDVARRAREIGGLAVYAHGGYAQAIYADVVQDNIDAVELLQFGVYRGIGLVDWYRMLNCGFRLPAVGACDYPACRKLGDCQTYAYLAPGGTIEDWLRAAAAGRSFVTTGPLLLLEVDGERPGGTIHDKAAATRRITARVRMRCEVTKVTKVQLIANGRLLHEVDVPEGSGRDEWFTCEKTLELDRSAWIAARAFSQSRLGTPDAESHTNPVFVYLQDRAPFDRDSLDALVEQLDKQIAAHKSRSFPEQARVLDYFERSRDILLKIRAAGGAPAGVHPSAIARDLPAIEDAGQRTHTDEELRALLQPIPPKSPEEAARSFEVAQGFRLELVACEPLVHDPVAAAFDEAGQLYVCEMRDYPYKPQPGHEPLGSVRLLRDTNGDGRFDEAHLFAEGLLWPAGVVPWQGGVFVAASPDIWYLRDTDGDFRADVRKRVFTGFGTQNQQAMVNNLQFGLDHKIYGSTAGNGGLVRPGDQPDAPGVAVDGRDFRFNPRTAEFETISGTVQFGNSFDDWGNRFLCSESQPLQQEVLPQHYLARNPFLPVPNAIHNLAPGPVPIFRISPIERWRQIRSSRRIAHGNRSATAAGASHHVIDAAAGVTVYRGGAYPPEYSGQVFITDAQNNLVHRRTLTPEGVTFTSQRVDEKTEFVRSSDNWFRPVNFVNAPDGTLYLLDMSREILETIHIPLDVVRHLDLRSGRDRGRIYRLAPPGFSYPGSPALDRAATAELVAALESPHGWWRDTAHRLIYERQDPAAVAPLQSLLRKPGSPQSRVHALHSLEGLGALADDDLLTALNDESPRVREHAIRLAEPRLNHAPRALERVLLLAEDADPRVTFQLASSLGEARDPRAADALAALGRRGAVDPWLRTAVLSSVRDKADAMLVRLLADPAAVASPTAWQLLQDLAAVVGAAGNAEAASRVLEQLSANAASGMPAANQQELALALGRGLKRGGQRFDSTFAVPTAAGALLHKLRESARTCAGDASAAESERLAAVELLSCWPLADVLATFSLLLDPREPGTLQIATVRSLGDYPDAELGPWLIARWRAYPPDVRQAVIDVLLAREDRTKALLEAAERGEVSLAQLDASRRQRLLAHASESIRSGAARILGQISSASRSSINDEYKAALSLERDIAAGEQVFRRECMVCHKVGAIGQAVGPDLASSPSRDPEALLTHVLDPNRYVLPNYVQYQVIDASGRIYIGIMAGQTATSITLQGQEGKSETLLRGNIDELASTGRSLMPEGLESRISVQEMAHLIGFLQAALPTEARAEAPLDIGTEPGLVEPPHDPGVENTHRPDQ